METIDGRVVVVTGAARGIGRGHALEFAREGYRVVVNDLGSAVDGTGSSGGPAGDVVEEIRAMGGEAIANGDDVADWDGAEHLIGSAIEHFGQLDVLVNNAGTSAQHPPLTSSYEEWQAAWARILAVNLVAAANATFRAVPHLIAAGGGAVVNVSSRGAFRGEPGMPAYGASKAGLNAFAQSMALALAPHGISVTCVAPGFVQTEMAREVLDGPGGDAVRAQSPFGRIARPEEVASAVVWLAEPAARFSSGTIVDVNGASYLRS